MFKKFTGLLLAILAISAAATAQATQSVTTPRRTLTFRVQDQSPAGQKLQLYFTHQTPDGTYFQGFASSLDPHTFSWSSVYARLRSPTDGSPTLEILFQDDERYLDAAVGPAAEGGTLPLLNLTAHGRAKGDWQHALTLEEGGPTYWIPYDRLTVEDGNLGPQGIEALDPVFSSGDGQGILDPMTVVGTLEYRPCDGCEHGDQMMVVPGGDAPTVNVVNLIPAKYYQMDCEGTVQPVLTSLMESGVKFTFRGSVTSLSWDYWEGGFWTSLQGGEVRVGAHGALTPLDLLDQVVALAGTDQVQFAPVVAGQEDLLMARFAGHTLRVNLETGRITAAEPAR